MPDSVVGLPLHPLAVHAAVVLVPLAAVMAIVIAVDPSRRRRFGVLVLLLTAAAAGSAVVARQSGQDLATSLYPEGLPDQVIDHQSVGLTAPWFALALLGGVAALLLLDRDRSRRRGVGGALLPTVLSVVVVLAAMAAGIEALWAGWTGAESRWGGVVVQDAEAGSSP